MSFLVEMRRHDLGHQGLQHIGKEEEQKAAEQPSQGLEDIVHVSVLIVLCVEAAHKERDEQGHSQEAPQWFLQHQHQAWHA